MGKNIDIDEIQKDISEYVSKKYGIKFKVAAFRDGSGDGKGKGRRGRPRKAKTTLPPSIST